MTESTEFRQDEGREDEDCPPPPIHAGAHARDMRIVNRKGLHARATAKFVQCVDRFDAKSRSRAAAKPSAAIPSWAS